MNGSLSLPTLGTWHRIVGTIPSAPAPGISIQLFLDQSYPDTQLGGQLSWRTYHFGIYGAPRPLLGEPPYQLPQRTCIDLTLSSPIGSPGQDYQILFGPGGQLVNSSTSPSTGTVGHVFLWLHDPGRPLNSPPSTTQLQQGGEQMIVVVKAKSGAVGTAPVDWAVATPPGDAFSFARQAVSGQ